MNKSVKFSVRQSCRQRDRSTTLADESILPWLADECHDFGERAHACDEALQVTGGFKTD